MKICILAVCHNSYKESHKFLESILKALNKTSIELDVLFIDNSTKLDVSSINCIKYFNKRINLKYFRCPNLGYFPSINHILETHSVNLSSYNYSIISNVDLLIGNSFFETIENIPPDKNVGAYAPSIFSNAINANRNPKMTYKPSAFKIKILRQFFRFSITYVFLRFINISRLKLREIIKNNKKIDSKTFNGNGIKIYAAHGSCIILTKEYTKKDPFINYPIFLFGEEIYIGETAKENNLDILYKSNLIVYDTEHASTSLMKPAAYRKYNFEALSFVLQKYKF